MRRLVLLTLLAAVLAQSAGAGTVDPARLVLRQTDVPSTYKFNRDGSGPRTVAQDSVGYPELKPKYATWGRLAGYETTFDKGDDTIVSRADVFRDPHGTRAMYAWFVAHVQQQQPVTLHEVDVRLGDQGVAYSYESGSLEFTVAVWRYRRVFSVVGGGGLSGATVLALARTQQRRAAAALR